MKNYSIIVPNRKEFGWTYGYGFFSNYRICLEDLIDHHEKKKNALPYISWKNTLWVESINPWENKIDPSDINPFDFWFDQDIPTTEDTCTNSSYPVSSYGNIIDHGQHYFDEPDQLKRQQLVDRLYIKPKQFIIDKVNRIFKQEFEGYKVLGLVARGTENILHHPQYGTFGIEDYINYVKAYLQENKDIDKVYIVSEDSHWVEALHKALPNSYFVPDVFRRTDETMEYMNRVHCWPCVSNKRKNQAQLLGEEIILQAKLLGKCQHLAGKHGGIMAGGVLWSENTEKVSIMKPC